MQKEKKNLIFSPSFSTSPRISMFSEIIKYAKFLKFIKFFYNIKTIISTVSPNEHKKCALHPCFLMAEILSVQASTFSIFCHLYIFNAMVRIVDTIIFRTQLLFDVLIQAPWSECIINPGLIYSSVNGKKMSLSSVSNWDKIFFTVPYNTQQKSIALLPRSWRCTFFCTAQRVLKLVCARA